MPNELDLTQPHRMYVAVMMGNGFGQEKTVEAARVTGTLESLKGELRQWLLNYLLADTRENGWYVGSLVEVDETGAYDTYTALVMEDVIWYWDQELVPRSQLTSV